jgi:hypothetical protein
MIVMLDEPPFLLKAASATAEPGNQKKALLGAAQMARGKSRRDLRYAAAAASRLMEQES